MRIVIEISSEGGTVAGTLTTATGSRSFWGWLELMSALELASGATPGESVPAGPAKRDRARAPVLRPGQEIAS